MSGDEFQGCVVNDFSRLCRSGGDGEKMDFGCFSSWISNNQIEDEELSNI